MENLAPTQYPVHPLIARRWSPRAFDPDRPVDSQALGSLFEAARWAPSSRNEQPWRFIVGANFDATHRRILGVLSQNNQRWARLAPVLLIAVTRLSFSDEDRPNRHAQQDLGLALENLFLQSIHLGLFCHYMAGFSAERAREEFAIPEGFLPLTAGAIGYLGRVEALPEDLQVRERRARVRRPLREFVFGDTWGAPLPLLDAAPR